MHSSRTQLAQSLLLPQVIDVLARQSPESTWCEYPVSATSFEHGFKSINYSQFANAVNKVALHLENVLERKDTGDVLAFLAPNDARCSISLVAAMKAGFKLFLTSERNSVAAHLKLFDELECSTIVTTNSNMPAIKAILQKNQMTVVELPPIENLIELPEVDYPYLKDFSREQEEIAFIVHTSGSTGLPKPMRIPHGYIKRTARNIGLPAPPGFTALNSMIGNNRNILLLPLGLPAGVQFGIFNPFFNNNTIILPIANAPPTGATLLEMLNHKKADWATMAPLILETLSKDPGLLDQISKHIKIMLFSGGSLPKVFGDLIAPKVKLTSLLGSSEFGPIPTIYPNDFDFGLDWNYLQIHPAVGAHFDPRPGNVYELVFKRTAEAEPSQTVFTLYPDISEYNTKDLFSQHPTYRNLWTHASRSDDVIVFLNGEKTNPVMFESHVSAHPEIGSALMFGSQHLESGVLLEMKDRSPMSVKQKANVLSRIWPSVQSANKLLPAFAQVAQSHVLFTDPDNPILRTLKGTVRRQATLDHYSHQINNLYKEVEELWGVGSQDTATDITSVEIAAQIVQESVTSATRLDGISTGTDLFSEGLDSLGVLRLVRNLRIKTGINSIESSTVYLNSSIDKLSQALVQLRNGLHESNAQTKAKRREMISKSIKYFSLRISEQTSADKLAATPISNDQGQVVLLTGSTGSIGAYILRELLRSTEVSHVYCLNRGPDSLTTQVERNSVMDPSLPTSFSTEKITFLTADLTSKETLGLSPQVYAIIQSSVTIIIHNAWTVDFNLGLESFGPLLTGMTNLLTYAVSAPRKPLFMYLSSISTAFNHEPATGAIPETIISDKLSPASAGYAESKYVGECLVDHASQSYGLRAAVLRLGQIAGPLHSSGRWNPKDWVPAFVKGSAKMRMVLNSLSYNGKDKSSLVNEVDWLPIDVLAEAILQIGLDSIEDTLRVFNILNPHPTTWSSMLPSIIDALEAKAGSGSIEAVDPKVWLTKLRTIAANLMDSSKSNKDPNALVQANPALKMLGFFESRFGGENQSNLIVPRGGVQRWEMANSQRSSKALANATPIDGQLMGCWVAQWVSPDTNN